MEFLDCVQTAFESKCAVTNCLCFLYTRVFACSCIRSHLGCVYLCMGVRVSIQFEIVRRLSLLSK